MENRCTSPSPTWQSKPSKQLQGRVKETAAGWGRRAPGPPPNTRGSSSNRKSSRSHFINLHVGSKCKVLLRALDLRLHKQCRFYAPLAGRAAAPGNGSGGVSVPLLLRGGEPRRAAGLPGGKQKRKDMCYRRRATEEEQQKKKASPGLYFHC